MTYNEHDVAIAGYYYRETVSKMQSLQIKIGNDLKRDKRYAAHAMFLRNEGGSTPLNTDADGPHDTARDAALSIITSMYNYLKDKKNVDNKMIKALIALGKEARDESFKITESFRAINENQHVLQSGNKPFDESGKNEEAMNESISSKSDDDTIVAGDRVRCVNRYNFIQLTKNTYYTVESVEKRSLGTSVYTLVKINGICFPIRCFEKDTGS